MSTGDVDTRIVSMQFENRDFIDRVKETISKLNELDESLVFKNSPSNLDAVGKQVSNVGQQVQNVEKVVYKTETAFSALQVIAGIAMYDMLKTAQATGRRIVNALYDPIVNGGKRRALNIENAKFQIQGLGYSWEAVEEDINYGVKDTAYGLDSAARVAAQLLASGVHIGDDMKTSLRSISGVAAMTNSSYDEIGSIFTTIASNGKLMTQQVRQLSFRGLNAAAVLAKAFNKTEQEINQMVSKGKISFAEFAAAMDDAFGEHAKKANETFTGAMSNVRAALARIGAKFATPAYEDLRQIFVQIIPLINLASEALDPLASVTEDFGDSLVKVVTELVETEAAGRALVSTMLTLYTWIRPFLYALVDSIGPVEGLVDGLLDLSKSMENLQLTGENAEAVYWVFRQIFDYIVNIVNGISTFIKLLKPFGAIIRAAFTVAFIAFATLARLLTEAQPILETISKFVVNVINIIGFGLAGALYVIGELIRYITGTGEAFGMLKKAVESITGSVASAKNVFTTLFGYIRAGLSSVAESFDGISDSTWKTVIAVALTIAGVTGMVMLVIKTFSLLKKPVTKVTKIGQSVFGGIEDIVHGITSVTEKAGKLLDRASIALVFAAIGYALSAIVDGFKTISELDWDSVNTGIPYVLGALALLGGFFALATVLIDKLKINVNSAGALLSGGMMLSLVLLLWTFVGAFAALTAISWDRIKASAPILAAGFVALIYFLSIIKAGMKATISVAPALFGIAAVMVSIGHAFMSLAASVIILTLVDWDKLSDGYGILGFAGFIVIALVTTLRTLAATCVKGGKEATAAVRSASYAITNIAKALFLMSASLGVFAVSLQMLSKVNYDGLDGATPWLIGFGTAIFLITTGLLLVCNGLEIATKSKLSDRVNAIAPLLLSISKSLVRLSFALIPLAVGLMLLSMVDWDTIEAHWIPLAIISGVLIALGVGLVAFSNRLGSTTTRLAKADKKLQYSAVRAKVHFNSVINAVIAIGWAIIGFTFALMGVSAVLVLMEKYFPEVDNKFDEITTSILSTSLFIAAIALALVLLSVSSGLGAKMIGKTRSMTTANLNQIFNDIGVIVKSLSQLTISVAVMFVAYTVMLTLLSKYTIDHNAIWAAIVAFFSGVAMLTLAIVSFKELLQTLINAIVMDKDDVGARTKAVFNYLRSMMSSIVLLSAIVLVMEAAVVLISWLSKVHGINVNYMVATAIQFFILMYGLKLSMDSIYAGVKVAAENFGNNYDQIIKSFWSLAGVLISVAIATAGMTAAIAYFTHVMNECEDNMAAVIMPLFASLVTLFGYLGILIYIISKFETVTEKFKDGVNVIKSTNISDDALVNFSGILFRLALSIVLVEIGMAAVVYACNDLKATWEPFAVIGGSIVAIIVGLAVILWVLNKTSIATSTVVNSATTGIFALAWKMVAFVTGVTLLTYLVTLVANAIANTAITIMETGSKIKWDILLEFAKLLGVLVIFGFAVAAVGMVLYAALPLIGIGVSAILGLSYAVTAMSLGLWSLVGAMTALGEAANNPVINDAVTGVITIVDLLGQIGATIAGAGILGILTAVAGPLAALSLIGLLMLGAIVTLLAASIVINVVADKIPETMEKFVAVTTLLIDTLTSLAALLDPVYMDVMNFTSTLVLLAAFLAVAGVFLLIAGVGIAIGANLMITALPLLEQALNKLVEISSSIHGWGTIVIAAELIVVAVALGVAGAVLAVCGLLLLIGAALSLAGVVVLSLFVDKLAEIADSIPDAMVALGLLALLIVETLLLAGPILLFAIMMFVVGPLLAIGGLLLMVGILSLTVAVMLMTPLFEKLIASIPVIEGATEALWALAKFGVSFLVVAAILAVVGVLLLIGGVALAIGAIALLISVASLTVAVMILGWMLVKLVDMIPLMQDATKALDPLLALIIKLGEVAIAFLIVSAIFLAIGVMFGLAAGLIGLGVIIFAASIVALVVIIGLIYLVASNLLPAIQSAFEAVVGVIGGIIDGIQNGFEAAVNAVASFVEAGANIVSGIVDGITSGISSAVDAITDLGNSIVDGFCDLLDINSPSEVFAEIGRFICEGLGIGIEENSDTAVSAAEDMGAEAADAGADAATEPSIWDRIVGFFTDTFGDAGSGGAFSLGEGFADSLPNLLGEFAAGGQACGQAFGDAFMAAMGMSIHDFGALQTANYYEQQAAIARGDAQHAVDVASEMSALNAAAADARARFSGFSVDDFFGELDLGGGGGMSGLGGGGTTGSTASAIAGSSGPGSGINDKSKIGSNNNINSNNTYNYVQNNYSPEPLDRTAVYMQTQRQLKSWGTWNRVHG